MCKECVGHRIWAQIFSVIFENNSKWTTASRQTCEFLNFRYNKLNFSTVPSTAKNQQCLHITWLRRAPSHFSLPVACNNNKILRIVSLDFSAKKLSGSLYRFKITPNSKKTKNSPDLLLLSQDKSVSPLSTAVKVKIYENQKESVADSCNTHHVTVLVTPKLTIIRLLLWKV